MVKVEPIISELKLQTDVSSFTKGVNFARDTGEKIDKELQSKLKLEIVQAQNAIKILQKESKLAKNDIERKNKIDIDILTAKSNLTELRRSLRNLENTGEKTKSRLGSLFDWVNAGASKFEEIIWWLGITAWISTLWNSVITLAWNLQQARIAFSTLVGSASKAEVLLKDLSNFAKNTPFELTWLREQTKLLLAYWFEASDIIPTLEALGNISAWVGTDKLPRLTYALWQVRAAGRLIWQDFRQFTQTGVNLWEELQKITGITEKITSANVAELWITYEQVQQALQNLWWEAGRFGGLMEAQSQTLQGSLSNLWDSLKILWEEIGAILIPALTRITQWITQVIDWFWKLKKDSPLLWKTLSILTVAVWWLTVAFGAFVALSPLIASAWALISWSLIGILWPIALVVGAIVALSKAYDSNFLWFKDFANKISYRAKVLFEFFSIVFGKIWWAIARLSKTVRSSTNSIRKSFSSLSVIFWPIKKLFDGVFNIIRIRVSAIRRTISSLLNAFAQIPWVSAIVNATKSALDQATIKAQGKVAPQWPVIQSSSDIKNFLWVQENIPDNVDNVTGSLLDGSWWGASKALEDTTDNAEDLAKELENVQESGLSAFDEMTKQVEDFDKEIEKVDDNISKLNQKLSEINASEAEDLAKVVIKLNKELEKAQEDSDFQAITKIREELDKAYEGTTEEQKTQIQDAIDFEKLSEVEKIKFKAEQKRKEIQNSIDEAQRERDNLVSLRKDAVNQQIALEKLLTEQFGIEIDKRISKLQEFINLSKQAWVSGAISPTLSSQVWALWANNKTSTVNVTQNITGYGEAEVIKKATDYIVKEVKDSQRFSQ